MNKQIAAVVLGVSVLMGMNAAEAVSPHMLTLTWAPNAQRVAGYEVYAGPSAEPTKMRLLAVPRNLKLNSPAMRLHVLRDLKALPGQSVCFRVKAYDNTAKSDFSQAVCTKI